jgi:hypothetical protein
MGTRAVKDGEEAWCVPDKKSMNMSDEWREGRKSSRVHYYTLPVVFQHASTLEPVRFFVCKRS